MSEQDLLSESQKDVYRELQQHLDTLPIGYPATKSGVEIKLLKQVFTPEEAEIASKLNFSADDLESIDAIHERLKSIGLKYTKDELEAHLDNMAKKGGILMLKEGTQKTYGNALFIVGIFEFQVNKLTKEFAKDAEQYLREGFLMDMAKIPIGQLRTIPIGVTIDHDVKIANFDQIMNLVAEMDTPIALVNCVCRQKKEKLGGLENLLKLI
jgi:hypothetical protein